MSRVRKTFVKQSKIKVKKIGVLCFSALALCLSASFSITKNTISANGGKLEFSAVAASTPPQTQASRIKIATGETLDVPVAAFARINSLVVVSPEIAAAQIKTANILTVTGIQSGETILFVSDAQKRLTLVVEVGGKHTREKRRDNVNAEQINNESAKISGSYTATYIESFDGNPSLFRNAVEFRRELSNDKTLRVAGEFSKEIGGEPDQGLTGLQNFGINQLSVGIDSPGTRIDFLDSQIRVSPLGLNGFSMRGFHLAKTPETLTRAGTQMKGVEVFAGFARPSLTLYDNDGGKIAGAFLPVLNNKSLQVSAGFIMVSPGKNNRAGGGGTVLQLNASYTPNNFFSADGETAIASSGGFSWRTRADLKLRQIGASAEIIRFDKDSPLNSIGAQTGGRKSEGLAFYWRPENRFNAFVNYNHTKITRSANSVWSDFNRRSFLVSTGYRLSGNSRISLRYLDQHIETAVPGAASKFQIATRSITAAHNIRFNRNWANNFEARINFSREAEADAGLENGFAINEQLRFSRDRLSVTGFFNYVYKTPSLTSLIVRNPRLLPPLLREAFVLNPVHFLDAYRGDRLGFLLGGVDLPQTRSLDAGGRFQTSLSRFTVTGEARYRAGEILSLNQKNLFTSVGLGARLDAANSIQINGWKSFGAGGQSAMTFSFTHRFGAESGGGFQISKLLGFDRGRAGGRVFYDLNGNGQDEADEPGVAGATIQLNKNRSVTTDARGRYEFSAIAGEYEIALMSDDLGVHLRASTVTRRKISLRSRQSINVSFGVSDFGSAGGRVFNDLDLSGTAPASNIQGVGGVKITLRSSGNIAIAKTVTNGNGTYEFQNLRPGTYTLEMDVTTLPANFRFPARMSHEIKVEPLRAFYLDMPIAAQRAVAGIVFVDKDGDGTFNPQTDEPIEGAVISSKDSVAVSDRNGAYILRNLAAGKVELLIRHPQGSSRSSRVIELDDEPIIKRGVNLPLAR